MGRLDPSCCSQDSLAWLVWLCNGGPAGGLGSTDVRTPKASQYNMYCILLVRAEEFNPVFVPDQVESLDGSGGSACQGLIQDKSPLLGDEAAGLDGPSDPASAFPLQKPNPMLNSVETIPAGSHNPFSFVTGLDPNPRVPPPPELRPCLETPSSQDPEAFAVQLLDNLPINPESVLKLMSLLPKETPRPGVQTRGHRFSSGAWVHGGMNGLYRNASQWPAVTKVLCALVRQVLPDHPFNAVTVLDECDSTCHRDVNNRDLPPLIIPLTSFKGGALWYSVVDGPYWRQTPSGRLCGDLLDVAAGPQLLPDPRKWHAVEPWEGRRAVLLAFTVRDDRLSAQDGDGFQPVQ